MNVTYDDAAKLLDQQLDLQQQNEDGLQDMQGAAPRQQDEIARLVVLARSLEDYHPPGPSPRFVHTARTRIWNRLQHKANRRNQSDVASRTPSLSWRRALAGALLALVLVFSGLGVASASALPGDALYGLKRGIEDFQLSLAFSLESQASLLTRFVEERIEEVEALSQRDRPQDLVWALDEYSSSVDELVNLASTPDEDGDGHWSDLQTSLSRHTQVLEGVIQQVPESAQGAIQQAIERSSHGQAVLELLQQGGNPSDLAPGQQDRSLDGSDPQSDHPSNNGNAYGRFKDKRNPSGNRGNQGRGNSNEGNHGNPHDAPDDGEEESQDED